MPLRFIPFDPAYATNPHNKYLHNKHAVATDFVYKILPSRSTCDSEPS
jgi:hypothetical protein